MLVASFAGFETMRAAYQVALESDYRFYSLGDADRLMLKPDVPTNPHICLSMYLK